MSDYFNNFKNLCIAIFFLIIALLITILVINNRIYEAINSQDNEKVQEYIKAQKGLIWTNMVIIIVFFLFLILVNLVLLRTTDQYDMDPRKASILIKMTMIVIMFIVSISLTIYMNYTLDNIDMQQGKEMLMRIYIIIPIINVISLLMLINHYKFTLNTLLMFDVI